MAEYLSPGVYVEEFDSGVKAMEGVGTSTAGFIGMAQKGPVKGMPVLITSMAEYQRRFGGYLPERIYGDMRFLPYAVEQFFNNGGSSCYVMRVCGEEAQEAENQGEENQEEEAQETENQEEGKEGGAAKGKPSSAKNALKSSPEADPFLSLKASNPGAWGNAVQVVFTLQTKGRTLVKGRISEKEGEIIYELSDASGLDAEDIVCLQQAVKGSPLCFGRIKEVDGSKIYMEWQGSKAEELNFPQKGSEGNTEVFLYLAEWGVAIQDGISSEQYESVSLNPGLGNFVENMLKKSQIVEVKAAMEHLAADGIEGLLGAGASIGITLIDGSDGAINKEEIDVMMYKGKDGAPDSRTGLEAFRTLSDVSIMAIPGITDKDVQSTLVSHCENMGNRFAILDMPLEDKEVSELQEFRENVDSAYAAMYHPWVQCYDPLAKRGVFLPPSGSVAGIYGRTDHTRGVHKAPANEIVRNCTGLSVHYNEAEQAKLNPRGINLIRALPGQGIRVWGARTCSSDGNWKYVNVKRLFIFIEESIRANTNWAVFEPNDEMLWSRVEGTIRVFLTTQWRNGALAGSTADEAFFVNIGKSTMTQDDILNGRLICVIGVAPVRPAEFVIFRITQKMESAQ